jgi:3-methyladenine DNA glycosylase AlkD
MTRKRKRTAKAEASSDRILIADLKSAFQAAADPERAVRQQAYMKSTMPHYGIQMPDIRRICQATFSNHPQESRAAWIATIEALWWEAERREERYGALELLAAKAYRQHHDADLLDLLKTLITSGAWWDYVDPIAINLVGRLLRHYPDVIRPQLHDWSTGDDMWLRRSAILAQLKFKQQTDWRLLQRFIMPSQESTEFFLRKGIGWALREYSKTEPDRVLDYVRANHEVLSGLTKREGLKVLLKSGVVVRGDPIFAR